MSAILPRPGELLRHPVVKCGALDCVCEVRAPDQLLYIPCAPQWNPFDENPCALCTPALTPTHKHTSKKSLTCTMRSRRYHLGMSTLPLPLCFSCLGAGHAINFHCIEFLPSVQPRDVSRDESVLLVAARVVGQEFLLFGCRGCGRCPPWSCPGQ
jgi:hypothetical protein